MFSVRHIINDIPSAIFSGAIMGLLQYQIVKNDYGFNLLQVTFGDRAPIELDISEVFKDATHHATLFDSVNQYIDTLPVETQEEIFNTFFKVYAGDYKAVFDSQETVTKLENKIAKITELLNYENFKIWIGHQSDRIVYPDNILTDYVHDPDMNTTIEKTYIKKDYTDLIALIIFLRMLSPLYIEFHNYVRAVTPHHYFKVYMLFVRSGLQNTKEAEKLRTYIDVNQQTLIGANKSENLIIYAGLADDDILDLLMSEVIFNKLLTIDFFYKKCNIISFIFQTIKYKGSYNATDGSTIRWKPVDKNPGNSDISYFEDYRKTSDVPIGTVVEIQHSLSEVQQLLNDLGRTDFDFDRYNQEVDLIKSYMDTFSSIQIYVLGWFLGKIINPRALYYIEPRKLAELMIFARVILIQDKQYFMAAFLGCHRSSSINVINVMIKNTLNKSVLKSLTTSYKFTMEDEKMSTIEKTISEASREVTNNLWVPTLDTSFHQGVNFTNGFLEVPGNINEIMYGFIAYCNQ